ncbi:cyclase family protein [Amycolatopsis sp. H20-H5]|uniref:cyclase family protein n=1 Tax=Amycolatopsis sp. H20-H5 TaxID=3046309 RepID=UPI002DBA9544|nr:cyclase family protein [Amycolatopsis sp. H20-H5]MEC3982710.1 cyclase family protein [Amycolatopsis sp. H20-H5]
MPLRRRAFAAGVAGLFSGLSWAAARPAEAASVPPFRLDQLTLVNLSHVNDPAKTNGFPGDPAFTLETIATIPQEGYYLQFVREGEHTGTHWGAPGHFNTGEALADQMDPGDLFLPAVKIDIRAKAAANPDYAVTIDDLKAWERRYGRIPDGSMVVLWTGWESRWGTPSFPNLDTDGVIHQPGFSIPAVKWLIDTGRIGRRGGTGTDTFSPDVGTEETYTVSKLVYQRRRVSLEILANLRTLPTTGAWVLVGGPLNRHGAGSTATIFGVLPPGVRAD